MAADGRISVVIACTAADATFDQNVINAGIGAIQSQTPLFRDNMVSTLSLGPYVALADLNNLVALVMGQITTEITRRRAVNTGKPSNSSVNI